MLNTKVWGRCTKLAKAITSTDTQITLPVGDGSKFRINDQEHFYLTLRNGGVMEVVKVVARAGDVLTVERAQDNTTAQTFGKGSCACVEWNPQQLCEFVKSCAGGCTNITPQTFVVTCGTSVTVNECGNITAINGSETC